MQGKKQWAKVEIQMIWELKMRKDIYLETVNSKLDKPRLKDI